MLVVMVIFMYHDNSNDDDVGCIVKYSDDNSVWYQHHVYHILRRMTSFCWFCCRQVSCGSWETWSTCWDTVLTCGPTGSSAGFSPLRWSLRWVSPYAIYTDAASKSLWALKRIKKAQALVCNNPYFITKRDISKIVNIDVPHVLRPVRNKMFCV